MDSPFSLSHLLCLVYIYLDCQLRSIVIALNFFGKVANWLFLPDAMVPFPVFKIKCFVTDQIGSIKMFRK